SDLETEPTKEKVVKATKLIKDDANLPETSKLELINIIKEQYVSLFNFDNCPDDYEELKAEAKFFAGMIKYNFLLMAQRLIKIRDGELYRNDGYKDFSSFIKAELNIAKRTVYDYINIIEEFGVRLVAMDREVEYSKLLPIIPLLKSKNKKIPKKDLKEKYLKEIENKSKKQIQIEARNLKEQYGISKSKINSKDAEFIKTINWIINKVKLDNLTETQAEKLLELKTLLVEKL
ncbi:MAG: hypothetical protein ACOCUI_01835, partial [bacterium]